MKILITEALQTLGFKSALTATVLQVKLFKKLVELPLPRCCQHYVDLPHFFWKMNQSPAFLLSNQMNSCNCNITKMMRVLNILKSIISNIYQSPPIYLCVFPSSLCHNRSGKPSRYDCLRLVNGMGSSFTSKELVNMVAVCRGSVTWAWNRWMKGCVELVIIYTWHVEFYKAYIT